MLRNCFKLLLFFLLITGVSAVAYMAITIKNSVDMRNGPGSYYQLVVRLKPGAEVTELEKEQQWLKIETVSDGKVGWIPERSIYRQSQQENASDENNIRQQAQDAFDQLSDNAEETEGSDAQASPAQIAAAVKGFAEDFTSQKTESQDVDLLENFDGIIDPQNYEKFRSQRLGNWSWETAQSRHPVETDEAPSFNPMTEQVGWAIANVVAQQGIVNNRGLQQYLTHVALIVAENTQRYETPVQVYVLDTDKIVGYACPNGVIFVSKGALQIMESEAEFAFFAAHELAHVVLNHGLKETKRRKPKIFAEQEFQALNEELEDRDQKYVQAEKELTQLANQMYEYTVKERLARYEHEADHWGVLYAYRTGYNPQKGLNLLRKIYARQGDFEEEIGATEWDGASVRKRINNVQAEINKLEIPDDYGLDYEVSFQQKLKVLGQ